MSADSIHAKPVVQRDPGDETTHVDDAGLDLDALQREVEQLPEVDRDFIGWYELGEVRRQKVLRLIAIAREAARFKEKVATHLI